MSEGPAAARLAPGRRASRQRASGPGLFVYGTLLDDEVRALVLGRALASAQLAAARLRHHRRVYVAGRLYPVVQPRRGAAVDGLLLAGLDEEDYARLDAFEGTGYRRERQHIWPLDAAGGEGEPVSAWLYRPRGALQPSFREWRLDTWRTRDKAAFLRQAREWLGGGREAAPAVP